MRDDNASGMGRRETREGLKKHMRDDNASGMGRRETREGLKKHMRDDNNCERHVVLVAPEVHWNTGNIGRTCLGAGAFLHLVKPFGFSLDDRHVKRAGLDYWPKVRLSVWDDFSHLCETMKPEASEIALFSKNGAKIFWSMPSQKRMFLIFGSETKGLPEDILKAHADATYQIPITEDIRSLNLSTAVGIALYESLRSRNLQNS